MKVVFRTSFARDLKKIKDQAVLDRVRVKIIEVESTAGLQQIHDLKKIIATGNFYRIQSANTGSA